jgi:beta-glucanase (GH16 family)
MNDVRREADDAGLRDLTVLASTAIRRAGITLLCLQLLACGGGGSDPVPAAGPAPVPAPAPPAAPPTAAPAPAPAPAPGPEGAVPAGYTLVWADEFSVDGLPSDSRWAYDTERNRLGWYNNELQYYASGRADNAVVRNGRLVITARRESLSVAPDWGGQRYTSARLITRGKASWTYGHFEIRAKLPCGRGTWPAIWTLGTGGVWPDDGEIDIMEQVGSNPSRVFGTVHTLAGSGGASNGGDIQVPDACTRFHDYQMTWTDSDIRFAVDGVEYHRYVNPRRGLSSWPFDAPQYLLLNIAIGGTLGGVVDDGIFPVSMEIEHVRVYQATN